MTEEEKVNTLTLANYFGSIKRFKWWVIGATVLSTLGGYLFVKFGLNRMKEGLSSEFNYNINLHIDSKDANNSDLAYSELTHYLADNSIYNYSDIVSEDRLVAVKEANSEYANINVKSMLQSGAISIEREGYTDSTTGKMVYFYPERYTLKVSASYFKDVNQGRAFIKDLVSYQLNVATKANNSYVVANYISDNFASSPLFNRIETLEKQYKTIKGVYADLNEEFTEGSLVEENVSLRARYNDFVQRNSVGTFTKFESLKNDYRLNHYVDLANDTVEKLVSRAEEHKARIGEDLVKVDAYEKSLDKLVQTTTITTVEDKNILNEKIIALTEDINEFKLDIYNSATELKNLGYVVPEDPSDITLDNLSTIVEAASDKEGAIQYLRNGSGCVKPATWEDECNAFVSKVNGSVQDLKTDADNCTTAYHNLYNSYKNKVNFFTSNFATVEHHVNVLYGIIIGLIGGFLVSSIVVMIIHINKPVSKKEEK